MKYEHVVSAVYDQPWAILASKYAVILDLLAFRAGGGILTEEEIQDRIGAVAHGKQSRSGAVAVLPLVGVMSQRMNMMSAMSGGTSTELFGKMFKDAVNDPSISGIVLDIDSPGGSVFGVQELAQTVMDARGTKPVIAFANSMAASAAFWVAAAADEIVVTPGGQVGSIGVLTAHSDMSAALEMEGEKITLISAGKKKVDANPIEPLSPEAKADLQATVDTYYASFVGVVAKGRGVTSSAVRSGFGQGGMVGAVEAVKQGMADRIGTLEMAISRAAGRGGFAATSGFHQVVGETTLNDSETTTTTASGETIFAYGEFNHVAVETKEPESVNDEGSMTIVMSKQCQNESCADHEYRTGKPWADCPDCLKACDDHQYMIGRIDPDCPECEHPTSVNDTDLRDRRLALQELTGK